MDQHDEQKPIGQVEALIKQSQSEVYLLFKQLEITLIQQFSGQTLKVNQIFSLCELNTKDLEKLFECGLVLIQDGLDFITTKKIDQRIWDIIRKQFEFQGQVQTISPDHGKELQDFFQNKIDFYKAAIKLMNKFYHNIFESEIIQTNIQRRCLANHYCYLGDIYQYMEKSLRRFQIKNDINLKQAAGLYNRALQIYPFFGKFHYLYATLMMVYEDTFAASNSLLKAYLCVMPYNCKENLQEIYEQNRELYIKWAKDFQISAEVPKDHYFKVFMIFFIRLSAIIFTKIGFEELSQLQRMFLFFRQYTQILNTNIGIDHKRNKIYLMNVILMTNFGVHYSVFGQNEYDDSIQVDTNDIARESIKYAYGIYIHILDFVYRQMTLGSVQSLEDLQDQPYWEYVELLIPILYYLFDQPKVCQHLLEKFAGLNGKLSQIYWIARNQMYKMESIDASQLDIESNKICALQEKLQNQFVNHIMPFERDLIGYQVYRNTFQKLKVRMVASTQESFEDKIILLYVCEQIIQKLSGFKMEKMTEIQQVELDVQEVKTVKQLVVLDGMNVAIRYGQECKGDNKFFTQGLKIALKYWTDRGHEVLILLPDFCYSVDEIEKKKAMNKNVNKLPDDVQTLRDYKLKGLASGIPNWNYDDSYMIQYARNKNGFILTNDRYNDHIKSLDGNIVEREKLKEWIKNNCINYTFIKDELIPNPDFMKNQRVN